MTAKIKLRLQSQVTMIDCTTTYPFRTAGIKVVTMPNTSEDMEELHPSHIAGGNVKLYSHSGKTKHTFTI